MKLKLSVDYYNSTEKALFEKYPNFDGIDAKLTNGISVPKDEMLAYMMFTEQKDKDGFRTYKDLESLVQGTLGNIDRYLDFSKGSIQAKHTPEEMKAAGVTERVGVAVGLSVVNQFHGLTEADWKITENKVKDGKRQKDFDYEIDIASDGERFIQVENKGAVADNNGLKASISDRYSDIKAKKKHLISEEEEKGIPRHQNIYYGTIGVLDSSNTAKVWLVDPPSFDVEMSPRKFKILQRLQFYTHLCSEVGVNKKIIMALYDRIEEISSSSDFESYNRKLLPGVGSPLRYFYSGNLVTVNTNEAFGKFFAIKTNKGNQVGFVGVTLHIVKLLLRQDFDAIMEYKFSNAEYNSKVTVELSSSLRSFSGELFETDVPFVLDESKNRWFYQYYGMVSYTSAGRIFGIVNKELGN